MSDTQTIERKSVRLEDDNGVQFVPGIDKYIPSVLSNEVFVIEYGIVGGTDDWRVDTTDEYIMVGGVKVRLSDCEEVV